MGGVKKIISLSYIFIESADKYERQLFTQKITFFDSQKAYLLAVLVSFYTWCYIRLFTYIICHLSHSIYNRDYATMSRSEIGQSNVCVQSFEKIYEVIGGPGVKKGVTSVCERALKWLMNSQFDMLKMLGQRIA